MAGNRIGGGLRDREKNARPSNSSREPALPTYRDGSHDPAQKKRPRGPIRVKSAGESGRVGFHPLHFFTIIWHSSSHISKLVNILWPFVPAAIAVRYCLEEHHKLKFSLAYIAMVPSANLVGFAGQELAKKLPHVFGVLLETTISSVVEIILFMVLLVQGNQFYVIRAAILGSILATMLLCLGMCFFVSGIRREESHFSSAISEVGSNLLLIGGLGLAIPTIFQNSINSAEFGITQQNLDDRTIHVSRIVSVLLLISYAVYVYFQTRTHHGIFDAIFEMDEERDADGHKDAAKPKLTLTECILALAVSVALVAVIAVILVGEIEPIVETGVSDPFMGLILVPLVEKAAEHLTALDEAYDNQINLALSHCVGATIQTAMLNAPLVIMVSWGLNMPMDLAFDLFDICMLLLAIITVGNFLRDQKSDYLEGFLCIIVYVAIAVAAFYFPNPVHHATNGVTTE
ncbi:calcium/proton exchanger [Xylariomycetidae sp. FL0641]|nr:calcium/proton exchanger [Xylariomycetidae sp. FL0641]